MPAKKKKEARRFYDYPAYRRCKDLLITWGAVCHRQHVGKDDEYVLEVWQIGASIVHLVATKFDAGGWGVDIFGRLDDTNQWDSLEAKLAALAGQQPISSAVKG